MISFRRTLALVMLVVSCKDEPAVVDAAATATPSVSASALPTTPSASASASAAPEVVHDCPPNSAGPGSFGKPCDAKGSLRMMEVMWTGKNDPASGAPSFRVVNKAPKAVLYGKVVVYFYDSAGKQIDVKEATEGSDKTHPYHVCSGNLFGVIQPNEKAVYNFSCAGKSTVPAGVAAIEAEAQMVGFVDASGKKNDFFWRNTDLTPDQRPKGGVK